MVNHNCEKFSFLATVLLVVPVPGMRRCPLSERSAHVGRGLAPQVLKLFRSGGAPQYLVAVGVAPKARYHVAGPLA